MLSILLCAGLDETAVETQVPASSFSVELALVEMNWSWSELLSTDTASDHGRGCLRDIGTTGKKEQ